MRDDMLDRLHEGGVLKLDDWGVIRATGADARSFLHSQLTQDMLGLVPDAARLAGYCSAKGRLLASFVVWAEGEQDVLLACSADLLPQVLKRLSMFVLRARCKLSDARSDFVVHGVSGSAASALIPGLSALPDWGLTRIAQPDLAGASGAVADSTAIRLPAARVDGQEILRLLWIQPALQPAGPVERPLEPEVWRALEAASGVPRIMAATSEQFVPQMVNLELLGGVSFSKGCYPGQEVVARSQYRGTLKRRAQLVESSEPLAPGVEVFHQDDPGQPAGMVVNAGRLAEGCHLGLVELKLAVAGSPGLFSDPGLSRPLRSLELPYALPAPA